MDCNQIIDLGICGVHERACKDCTDQRITQLEAVAREAAEVIQARIKEVAYAQPRDWAKSRGVVERIGQLVGKGE